MLNLARFPADRACLRAGHPHLIGSENCSLDKFPPSKSRDTTFSISPTLLFLFTYFLSRPTLTSQNVFSSPSSSWVRRPLLCINFPIYLFTSRWQQVFRDIVKVDAKWVMELFFLQIFFLLSSRGGDGTFDFKKVLSAVKKIELIITFATPTQKIQNRFPKDEIYRLGRNCFHFLMWLQLS